MSDASHDAMADAGVDLHPDADKMTAPKWDEPGVCICGAVLPPMSEWENTGATWSSVRCSSCQRGFVDEDDFIAIYDDTSDWDDE